MDVKDNGFVYVRHHNDSRNNLLYSRVIKMNTTKQQKRAEAIQGLKRGIRAIILSVVSIIFYLIVTFVIFWLMIQTFKLPD